MTSPISANHPEPCLPENCPACFEAPKERQRMKQLLAQQELLFPRLYWNLKVGLVLKQLKLHLLLHTDLL